MPIYEYRCDACDHEMEALQKMSDDALVDCPECDKPELKKKISAAAFRLKGAGWYETDFKKSGDKKKNLAEDSSSVNKTDNSAKKESKSGAVKSAPSA